jgi:hypothetical protein
MVTLETPLNNRMFDVPPSGQSCHQSSSASTLAPTMPSITVNMPDILGSYKSHSSLRQSQSPPIASDPADYIDEPWPTLDDFLHGIQEWDRHKQDLTIHEAALWEQEILGPDDIARCSADELHDRCNIPTGTPKLLIAEGKRVTQQVKLEAQVCKCRRGL